MAYLTHSFASMRDAIGRLTEKDIVASIGPLLPDELPCEHLWCNLPDKASSAVPLELFAMKHKPQFNSVIEGGGNVYLHCRSGLCRSTTVAILAAWGPGEHLGEVRERIAKTAHNGQAVPVAWARDLLQNKEIERFSIDTATFPWYPNDKNKIARRQRAYRRSSRTRKRSEAKADTEAEAKAEREKKRAKVAE